ncbi:hypothetical protein CHS0354_033205 [Potamilus streckersoni]|uniref:Uncharacterized protein n=1 Tax=Potamilus streckersoni TaxID=2493646 RepID=A0AAE0VR30_9BIVA|nr:hypothetical protein CHS0354_033205 [Potamilus streckersoni]
MMQEAWIVHNVYAVDDDYILKYQLMSEVEFQILIIFSQSPCLLSSVKDKYLLTKSSQCHSYGESHVSEQFCSRRVTYILYLSRRTTLCSLSVSFLNSSILNSNAILFYVNFCVQFSFECFCFCFLG